MYNEGSGISYSRRCSIKGCPWAAEYTLHLAPTIHKNFCREHFPRIRCRAMTHEGQCTNPVMLQWIDERNAIMKPQHLCGAHEYMMERPKRYSATTKHRSLLFGRSRKSHSRRHRSSRHRSRRHRSSRHRSSRHRR